MRDALKLAASALGQTSPNPMVGALVTSGDEVIGRGFHSHAGADHAEVVALREAGERARGATLYITLEPCAHQGRTPPCVETILTAGPKRVVIAMEDPDERVRGKGIAALRAAGIDVEVGVAKKQAAHLNRMYAHQRQTGLPYVTLKMAQSLDGKIAAHPGDRLQLTGKQAQRLVRKLRFEHDAVMVGAGTVLADDPQLTVRPAKQRPVPYTRIVLDAHGRIPLRAKILRDQMRARTIFVTTASLPQHLSGELQRRNVTVMQCASDKDGLVDLKDAMRQLGALQILSILCEGGPTLAAALLRQGLVAELQWLIAPVVFGAQAVSVVGDLDSAIFVDVDQLRRLGDDIALTAQVKHA
ncbi:MAG: bifunctional diaminohydroxyphosphoribosylaminopyrimidine deaminase/5-amino-6-(5-phosphoribosylamino)uracil reductase RibD [Candidatus Eremiobacteraeota bacterium]|nr:bifunctional diaminohydroxyphosphoribosylaminopyrimidine deaminase/5-amino-6-(5-phosphoribosylamino)uracil reductase RibD [Candidatus Eremiobacteraeota bacterium]